MAIGQAGARGEGLGIELHLLLSVLLPGPGRLALGTDPGSTFPSLSKGPGSSAVSTPPPSHLPPSRLGTLWRWSWTFQPPSTLSTPDLDITVYFSFTVNVLFGINFFSNE